MISYTVSWKQYINKLLLVIECTFTTNLLQCILVHKIISICVAKPFFNFCSLTYVYNQFSLHNNHSANVILLVKHRFLCCIITFLTDCVVVL